MLSGRKAQMGRAVWGRAVWGHAVGAMPFRPTKTFGPPHKPQREGIDDQVSHRRDFRGGDNGGGFACRLDRARGGPSALHDNLDRQLPSDGRRDHEAFARGEGEAAGKCEGGEKEGRRGRYGCQKEMERDDG